MEDNKHLQLLNMYLHQSSLVMRLHVLLTLYACTQVYLITCLDDSIWCTWGGYSVGLIKCWKLFHHLITDITSIIVNNKMPNLN